jgi:hypothetical protein
MTVRPFGIHTLAQMFDSSCMEKPLRGNGWVQAVAEPYPGNRLVAAWWVLTGRAYAVEWPKPGDLENALSK